MEPQEHISLWRTNVDYARTELRARREIREFRRHPEKLLAGCVEFVQHDAQNPMVELDATDQESGIALMKEFEESCTLPAIKANYGPSLKRSEVRERKITKVGSFAAGISIALGALAGFTPSGLIYQQLQYERTRAEKEVNGPE